MTKHNPPQSDWSTLRAALRQLRADILAAEQRASSLLAAVHPTQRASARNLLHYVALRQRDHSQLQGQLAARGLSSLGRSESHVLAALDAVLHLVERIEGAAEATTPAQALTREGGQLLLREHTDGLLGAPTENGRARIMVTLPSEAAHDRELVRALVKSGMDCARINAAHDDASAWRAMATHVREASRALGRACSIAVDMPGPKCRTGALAPGPEVIKLRPKRGPAGEVLAPARAWLTVGHSRHTPSLPVPASFLRSLRARDELTLRDARGRLRQFRVTAVTDDSAEIVCERTCYVQRGTKLHTSKAEADVGSLPALEQPLVLHEGDTLALTRSADPGGPAQFAEDGSLREPARIPCEPPELLDAVRVGESVWLDDGKIGGVVESVSEGGVRVRITTAGPKGEKLRTGKGINLPDTRTTLSAFTERDVEALSFAVESADLISLSFVRSPDDVRELHQRLQALGRDDLGIVLKIETREGFDRLPELLLAAMRGAKTGVMIARGDLAVECGFERLAEVQEEILWLCEAAHVPVIWATQVLESLAKTGRPTRAEVTDAAMAERAECVMLNKGPFITRAVTLLDGILRRMASHQNKKSALFRELRVAARFHKRMDELAASAEQPARGRSGTRREQHAEARTPRS